MHKTDGLFKQELHKNKDTKIRVEDKQLIFFKKTKTLLLLLLF